MSFEPLSQGFCSNSFKDVQLIATDMDGTLTQSGQFTATLLQALTDLGSAGIQVVIVTGRSAGWVSGLVHYLPVSGAIAENGGIFFPSADCEPECLVAIANISQHRQQLAEMFAQLQTQFPQIRESTDNRFRLTDWTFDVHGLSLDDLSIMGDRCLQQGWGFTYSTVQCHIKSLAQDKARGLKSVLHAHFPHYTPAQIVTVGDSPNDESLFDPTQFPLSVGVANVRHYADQLTHQPAYITQAAEVEGFCELVRSLLGLVKQ
jgi:HAD superfamily hydrolase (TIGR01484 family)